MRKLSAQYIFTSSGTPLKRGVITLDDHGTVVDVEDTSGFLPERAGIEFYNGIIIPGMINSHCHLELSHMGRPAVSNRGLASFVSAVRENRGSDETKIRSSALRADKDMFASGTEACGDISNNTLTFNIKNESKILYTTFVEVFGIVPDKAGQRIDEAHDVAAAAAAAGLRHHITPHALYSLSQQLFDIICKDIGPASLTSLHFLESDEERDIICHRRGPLMASYKDFGVTDEMINTPTDHLSCALLLAKKTSRLILVHNTVISEDEASVLSKEKNIWFCLCPTSNMFISGIMPPVDIIRNSSRNIIIGTDSTASGKSLNMLDELKAIHNAYPHIPLDELIRWATINGAMALDIADNYGSIEPGKTPGILLIDRVDLAKMHLLPDSIVRRLL